VKVRLGYPDLATDVAVVRAVREAVGPEVHIMSDYNQCLPVVEAVQRSRRLDEEGLYWIEEPTTANDYEGNAIISREARTPIQIGENWWGPHDMQQSLASGASDFGMPDVMRIGGVSGWLRAAALAEPRGIPLSSHLFPEISAHLLAVTPTCHWLEYIDWASPILAEPVKIEQGLRSPRSRHQLERRGDREMAILDKDLFEYWSRQNLTAAWRISLCLPARPTGGRLRSGDI
jgi:mandelate racemase